MQLYAYWSHPTIYRESREVLSALRQAGMPVCLVSNIDNEELGSALRHLGLSFVDVITSECCRAYKPRAEMFEAALSRLGLEPCQVLHVGDSLRSDVRGAKALGIPVLWINRKHRKTPKGDDAPDDVSTDLRGLLALLRQTA